jgi:16S rRNA (cytosine967-C5)-methyltransferase
MALPKVPTVNNERLIAARIIKSVCENKTPLPVAIKNICNKTGFNKTPWLHNICYSVIRHLQQLEFIVNLLLQKPIRKKDNIVHYVLLIGICQIRFLDTPHHIAVDSGVKAGKKTKIPWAAKLINAILQNYIRRDKQGIVIETKEAKFSHPQWLIDTIESSYPGKSEEIFTVNNMHPPYTIRVNASKTSTSEYLDMLKHNDIAHSIHEFLPYCLHIKQSIDAQKLPGYEAGLFYVQDAAPQLTPTFIDAEASHTILDACAAPGGKTSHLGSAFPNTLITAVDNCPERIKLLEANLKRLDMQKNINVLCTDLSGANDWAQGNLFDYIVMDAPCSATGIIRRQPDIKVIKDLKAVQNIAEISNKILHNLWNLLKPSGKFLYATCSIMSAENSLQIKSFLAEQSNARLIDISHKIPDSINTGYGQQILPGTHNMDGFFYCLLEKI